MTRTAASPDGDRWLPEGLRRAVLPVWAVTVAGVVLWPFVVAVVGGVAGLVTGAPRRSLVLRDMVVPETMSLNSLATGSEGPARAVPQDAVLALLSPAVPPAVVAGLVVCGAGVAGCLGAAALARRYRAGSAGQALAALLVVWNPYVAERLLQGHWSVVAAGMLLPAVAVLALPGKSADSVRGRYGAPVGLTVVLAVCALTPTGLILGVTVAVVASGLRRRTLLPLVAGVVLALPWLVPSVVRASATLTDAAGAALFAARAEPGAGTLGALLGLGGVWNADAVPDHRVPLAGVALAAVAAAVAVLLRRRGELSGGLLRLSVLAVAAVAVPAVLATGPGLAVLGGLLEFVPGAGLLRDTQKFVVLALPALTVLSARVDVVVRRRRPGTGRVRTGVPVRAGVPVAAAAALAVLQVPALPADLADLRPVILDAGYGGAVEAVGAAGGGRTLLWPPGNYRSVDGRPALDPLLKMLPGSPVDPGYLIVDGRVVDGDPATVDLLAGLARGGDGLAEAGIDLVLVDRDAADRAGVGLPAVLVDPGSGHRRVWSAGGLILYRV